MRATMTNVTRRKVRQVSSRPRQGKSGLWTLVALLATCVMVFGACDASESHSLTVMNEGVKSYREGSYGTAITKLKKSIELWPDNAKANYLLGQIYLHKYREPDKAATYFGHATRLDATKVDYWYQLGSAQTELKRDDDARVALRKALELKPDHSEAHYRLGLVAERALDPKKAAQHYGDSIKANARIPYAYYNLGDLYVRNGKFDEARQVYDNGVGNNPENAEMRQGLGVAYLSLGRYDEARGTLIKAIELKKPYPSATYNLALSYVGLKDRRNAKQYLELFLGQARGGKENSARIAAAEARLLKIVEDERKGTP